MVNVDDLRKQVALLSDDALLEVQRDELVEAARQVYDAELQSRGLRWSATPEEVEEAEAAENHPPTADLVSLGKYESVEDARFARSLLEHEGIPVWFAGELAPQMMGGDRRAGLELLTRTEFAEQARLTLSTEVSDEELERQAEAAGEGEARAADS